MWEIAIVVLAILFSLGYVINKVYKSLTVCSRCCGCMRCPIKK